MQRLDMDYSLKLNMKCRLITKMQAIHFCLWALVAPQVIAQVIRFAPEKDYAPFVSVTPEGQVHGLSIDVLDIIKPKLGFEVNTLAADSLANILQAARRGDVDLISSLRPTVERSEYLAFTEPYVKVPAVLVVRSESELPKLKDLVGHSVAVGKGYAVEGFVRSNFPDVRWLAVPDDVSALRSLMRGEVEGVIADIASVSDATRHSGIFGVQVAETLPFEYDLSFAYRKELTQLGVALNAGLKQINPSTRQVLLRRWIDSEALAYEDPRLIWVRRFAIVLLVAVLISAALWHLAKRTKQEASSDGQ